MHVIIDLNCLSSCLSCLIKALGSVLISAISGNICPTNLTDLHGYAEI